MDNIFSKIIAGEIPSYTVYEDDIVKAFLDINPVSDGHTLIVPKTYFENIYDVDPEVAKHIEIVSGKIGKLLKEKLNCVGITRVQNNEYGQDVKYYHMHLIPRYEGDDLEFKKHPSSEIVEVKDVYEKITK